MGARPQIAWELKEISKRFAGIIANDRISLQLYAGEIHGLMGENGCGKSTLIKTLSGTHDPDSGQILKNGKPIILRSPIAAQAAGISTVFQEFSIVPTLSVAENIYLGRWPKHAGRINWRSMREGSKRVLSEMNVSIDPDRIVATLSVAEQQLVEIAKALATDTTLLILDEPTTALGLEEIARLHGLLRRLKARGVTIVYISHRLDEVVELVDRITILKDGKVASSADESLISIPFIVEKMVGNVGDHYPKDRNSQNNVALSVKNLSTVNRIKNVTFDVKQGEVYGLGGVLGSGRTEIVRGLFGLDAQTGGEIIWKGQRVHFQNPKQAIAAGFAMVPENRKFDGLFTNFTGFPNITSAALEKLGRRGILSIAKEQQAGREIVNNLNISVAAETQLIGTLSGGNQQKVIIGRWLFAETELFLLDEPTQGIDIGAKVAVYKLINSLTSEGKSVILISSDHEELLAMSDRIGIVSHGCVFESHLAKNITKSDLVKASTNAIERAA